MNAARVSVVGAIVLLTASTGLGAEAPPGASSCSGCHAAQAGLRDLRALGGIPAAEIAAKMTAFKSGAAPATIMDRIAKGFSDDEIGAIAAWYAAQKP